MADRRMTLADKYGQPMEAVLGMTHGLFRTKKQHNVSITKEGNLVVLKTADEGSDVLHAIPLKDIHSAGTTYDDDDDRLQFVVCTGTGSFTFLAPDKATLKRWVLALNPPSSGGSESGWLTVNKKKRFCELRKSSVVMFKEKEDRDPCGAIALDCLCTVIPPQQTGAPTGMRRMTSRGVTFYVNTAGQQWAITSKTVADANRWITAIQDAIECCPDLTTRFDKLATAHQNSDTFTLDEVFLDRAILCYSDEPLEMPLTPLPYGKIGKVPSGNEYGHPHIEALAIFQSMIPRSKVRFGNVMDGEPWIRNLLQVYLEVPALRNEIFCQSVKQITRLPDIHGRFAIRHWQLVAALCAHFRPASKYFNYIRACLHHAAQKSDNHEIIRQCANYCLEKMQKPATLPAISDELMREIMSGQGFAETESAQMVLNHVEEPDCEA
ncbi:hypothetical protein PTSG_10739 [Salpingoeca rosetta]|uniref:MyTH4 domain-containing protein n=1 Tax=Salpingoeca rosetta (strain ATCC 50818 / BSB-021) TaxID=946362 RepID=F2UQ87_SALR5|nr:uncharacterized protein PTSG_10739 [Salpingoeca rosetta]EGD79755.1 hypothetical protein PTSG_10739 [Salpingoeca rosetta]|eukprot:XP_004988704.1 hypothetical protein PTSG_10739 [Salpingoeca rosetta]